MRKAYKLVKKFTKELREENVSAYASSMAFFLFLSMIPVLMLICSLLPYTLLSEADLMMILRRIVPDSMDPLIIGLVSQVYDKSAHIVPVAILVTIWSAGKGMLALMRALNTIHDVTEKRGYFHLRAIASFYTVVILVAILFSLCTGVFGEQLLLFLLGNTNVMEWLGPVLGTVRFFSTFLILILAFVLLYTYVPDMKLKMAGQIPGALCAALGWNLCSLVFSWYVNNFNSFSAYGSLGTIIVFLLWLYFFCYIMLIGANINRHIKEISGYFRKN